ncbi:DNA phosphorothioation-associated putative methyltransferase [Chroococcidiopsis sp. CCMEE 29]|uniref:DNA phosphorothioation-associated putative methyltransferase n=1 Tax=Chroococcidiopsis sp. CCMEE 29 TaxID=155894 RepID=UPI002021558A|nr:DNA phosphorothioation-associated putative methyltransferase [Chroococcidiopsis sp. CCMEE 29]
MSTDHWKFPRHKAAMRRHKLSSPVAIAINKGILTLDQTFFDYGCGQGGDLCRLTQMGYKANGYDPFYFPDADKTKADVVNLSYVLGVINDIQERQETLLQAWALTGKTLIVSAQVQKTRGTIPHNDGWINKWNIYTKFWTEPEWRKYVEGVTGAKAYRIGKGVLVVQKPIVVELLAA